MLQGLGDVEVPRRDTVELLETVVHQQMLAFLDLVSDESY